MKSDKTQAFVQDNSNGIVTGYVIARGVKFPFTAKLGEWAEVERLDEDDNNYMWYEHKIAAMYATHQFVTNYNKKYNKV